MPVVGSSIRSNVPFPSGRKSISRMAGSGLTANLSRRKFREQIPEPEAARQDKPHLTERPDFARRTIRKASTARFARTAAKDARKARDQESKYLTLPAASPESCPAGAERGCSGRFKQLRAGIIRLLDEKTRCESAYPGAAGLGMPLGAAGFYTGKPGPP